MEDLFLQALYWIDSLPEWQSSDSGPERENNVYEFLSKLSDTEFEIAVSFIAQEERKKQKRKRGDKRNFLKQRLALNQIFRDLENLPTMKQLILVKYLTAQRLAHFWKYSKNSITLQVVAFTSLQHPKQAKKFRISRPQSSYPMHVRAKSLVDKYIDRFDQHISRTLASFNIQYWDMNLFSIIKSYLTYEDLKSFFKFLNKEKK